MTSQAVTLPLTNPLTLSQKWTDIAVKSQRVAVNALRTTPSQWQDDLGLGEVMTLALQRLWSQPQTLFDAQWALWQDYGQLWQRHLATIMGTGASGDDAPQPVITPARGDRRFKHDAWNENPLFDTLKQTYLVTANRLVELVEELDGLDEKTQRKLVFYTRQWVDALAPTNFPLTNPEVLRTIWETGGENLLDGLINFLDDLERGQGNLRIRMTDLEAFELGKNVASTPGKVVFQNELMQLLQYEPVTDEAFRRPLLIVPPWINKYYVLDLRPKNSFIKWWVDQGFTVFVISWVNPDASLAEKGFGDYLQQGPLAALEAIEQATGEREVNAVGYCLGGTLLAVAQAYLASQGVDRIQSCTFMTTMLDFTRPGDLEVFIDECQLQSLEQRMAQRGYLEGSEMATTFNMLRANDLIWSFFINNYLLGKEPFPFDLLYWNSDSTRMPAQMHSFYLRNMYLENRLKEPGGIELLGTPIDLGQVKSPVYFASTVEDHIAPWASTYAGTRLFKGPVRFVLGGSGHIAGAINPPAANKYGFWTNEALPNDSEAWLAAAAKQEGSWWQDWLAWVTPLAGEKVPARKPGDGQLPVLEDAPGSYVKLRIA
ncbi:MAG: class I poly(R)-hydroxyalkanoic acid synthase [Candidatus Competibacterales bacterium]